MVIYYKFLRSYILLSFIVSGGKSNGQDANPYIPAVYSSSANVNIVRSWGAIIPEGNPNNINVQTPVNAFNLSTQYLDGLGRPLQVVSKQGSLVTGGVPVDAVSVVEYDNYGRETRFFLPFAANSAGGNTSLSDGGFKYNPFQQQQYFYSDQNITSPIKGQGETFYYGKTEFELSPLHTITGTYAAGNSWVYAGKGNKVRTVVNTSLDSVRIWLVTDVAAEGSFETYSTTAMYTAGTLVKVIGEDESGNQVITFKDKEGKVLLKKIQLLNECFDDGTGKGHYGFLSTYYVYDDMALLRAVIQPKAVELMGTSGWSLTSGMLDELVFRYEYDSRDRMIVKKVPSAGETYMIYDGKDRLVMAQDANMRLGTVSKWIVTLYDALSRPVQVGLLNNSYHNKSFEQHRVEGTATITYPFSLSNTPSSSEWQLLTEVHYDNYDGVPPPLSGSLISSSITTTNFITTYNSSPQFAQELIQAVNVKGLATWTKTNILGTSGYLYTVNIYDLKQRLIQVKSTNISGGVDVVTNQYAFSGKLLRSHLSHEKAGIGAVTHTIASRNTYDDLGRLIMLEKKVNGSDWKTLLESQYNSLGQLVVKKLGKKTGTSDPLETIRFDFNIRGWILGMNRDFLMDQGTAKFGYEVAYDKRTSLYNNQVGNTYAQTQYNGNISGTIWKSAGDNQHRKYDFGYDAANRLLAGSFSQKNGTNWDLSAGVDFTVGGDPLTGRKIEYDANGNIIEMWQRGLKGLTSEWLDKLTYTYYSDGNRLKNVIDEANNISTKLGDFRTSEQYMSSLLGTKTGSAVDYTYDYNGNLLKDLNKDIVTYSGGNGIEYNHLNLPSKVIFKNNSSTNKGTVEFTYDAAGNKLQKKVTEGAVITTTQYISGSVYENDQLQAISHEEGKMRPISGQTSFNYDYFIKDHLGNVRMVLTEEERSDQYPAATMEDVGDPNDLNDPLNYIPYYSNVDYNQTAGCRTSVQDIVAYPDDPNGQNEYVVALNGEETRIGPSMTLKVMSGDKINIQVNSWYQSNNLSPHPPNTNIIEDLVNAFSRSAGAVPSVKASEGEIGSSATIQGILSDFVTDPDRDAQPLIPHAFVNWILFNEQFKMVASSSGFEQVPDENQYNNNKPPNNVYNHIINDIPINANGYLYVYVSNQTTNIPVYFDNLQVSHNRGPILEETHYYPFGLPMAGISSKAAGVKTTRQKYNGKEEQREEFADGSGLGWTDFGARMYDNQIGRWMAVDPLASNFHKWSPYTGMGDNPLRYIDPDGRRFVNFDADGNFTNITQDNWLHNLFNGSKGRVMDDKGKVTQKFKFADPKNDVKDIKAGRINKLESVQEKDIVKMLVDADVFKPKNKEDGRYSFILREGVGGGKLDFSYSEKGIQEKYAGKVSNDPLAKQSPTLFLVDGVAHNHMNFGNFLLGAAGKTLGLTFIELSLGAHWNSVANPGENNYDRQLDSPDDQRSIRLGVRHARNQGYSSRLDNKGSVVVGETE